MRFDNEYLTWLHYFRGRNYVPIHLDDSEFAGNNKGDLF